jgi:hypothetical protein
MMGYAVPFNSPWFARYNALDNSGTVERSSDGGLTWQRINDAENIESAKIASDGQIHVKTKDGLYFYSLVANGQWLGSNSGNYDGLTVVGGAIPL